MIKVNFFIVGAPRCGTTALNVFLARHPDIVMARKKESHFFARDLYADHFIQDKEVYFDLFEGELHGKFLGETSVMYMLSRVAAKNIQQFNKDARIIAILRNPVDMLYSVHSHNVYNGTEDQTDFAQALEKDKGRRLEFDIESKLHLKEQIFYEEQARYSEQLGRYIKYFGRDRVHLVINEELLGEPVKTYRSVLQFLGVNDQFLPAFETINANRYYRIPAFNKVVKAMSAFLPNPLSGLVKKVNRRFNTKEDRRKNLEPKLRKRIIADFEAEIKGVEAILGRSLDVWKS